MNMPGNLPNSQAGYWLAVVRTFLFYTLWFIPWNLVWCSLIMVFGWFIPMGWRNPIAVRGWSWPLIWGAWLITGVRYRVTGRENIPSKAILVANHQSTWETIFMLGLVSPQVPVLKRSLLSIPVFGWALRTIYPIAIIRDNPREAAKSVME